MFSLCLTILAFALSLCVFFLRLPSYRTYRLAQKIKGPNKFWIFGLSFEFVRNNSKNFLPYIKSLVEKNGGLVRFWLLGTPMVIVVEPEHVKAILMNPKNLKKGWEYDVLHELLGGGILSDSHLWSERRKLLNPLFNYKNVDGNLTKSIKHVGKLVEILMNSKGEPVDIYEHLGSSALEYICETVMAVDDLERKEIKHFRESLSYLSTGGTTKLIKFYLKKWMYRHTKKFKIGESHKKFADHFADKLINKRRLNIENLKHNSEDTSSPIMEAERRKKQFLDTLLEPRNDRKVYLSDIDIRDEVKTILVAAHETTATTIGFALFRMAIDEEILKKAYEEQYTIFEKSDRDPTYDDIQEMSYLTKIIKECLRLYPAVPYLSRILQEDIMCGDVLIPKGTNVVTSPYVIHRQEKMYPDPDKFDPERFSPEEIEKRHPFAFIPFGAGPRHCIGQNIAMITMKVYLSTILRKFKPIKVTEIDEVVLKMKMGISTTAPIFIRFLPRE